MKVSSINNKLNHLEKEIKKLKLLLYKEEKKIKPFSSLAGILKNKTDLSLEEIQSFKYKAKSFK
jgi:archaellum component FlaC